MESKPERMHSVKPVPITMISYVSSYNKDAKVGKHMGQSGQHDHGMERRQTRACACHLDNRSNEKAAAAVSFALTMFGYC